jgi:peptide/nickel transport system substrate-binding protein
VQHRQRFTRNALATIACSLTTLALAAAFIAGCGRPSGAANNSFAYNEIEDLNTLDPARTSARTPWWVGGQIYVGLVGLDSALAPIPMIAKSWSTSEDGRQWTFNLRSDVLFADDPCFPGGTGRKVTAEDVRYSFERICNPATASTGFWVFRGKVVGAEEYYNDSAARAKGHVAGFNVLNDTTLRIDLVEPSPLLLSLLSMPYCYVVPREAAEKYGTDFFRHPVGAGPFRLAEWKSGERLVLTRNPHYFEKDAAGKALPYLDSVVVTFIADKKTEFAEFQSGHLDAVTSIDPAFLDQVISPDGKSLVGDYTKYHLFNVPSMSIEYYGIMLDAKAPGAQGSPLVANRFLRRAINYAIDREAIVRYVLHGQAIPASHGPIPPGIPGYSGVEGFKFDREMARKLLDSAGYPGGKGLPELALQISESERAVSVAQAIKEQLSAIGVNLKINRVSPAQHRSMAADGKLPFWRANWMADYPDAENFIALFYSKYASPSGSNTTRFANPTVDSLYRAALAPGLGTEQRAVIYGAAERIILDQAPWILIYHSTIQRLTQPGIDGYFVDPLDRLVLTRVRKHHT